MSLYSSWLWYQCSIIIQIITSPNDPNGEVSAPQLERVDQRLAQIFRNAVQDDLPAGTHIPDFKMDWPLFRREALRGAEYTANARHNAWVLQPHVPRDEQDFVPPEDDSGDDLDITSPPSSSSGSSYEAAESDAPTDDSEPDAQLSTMSLLMVSGHQAAQAARRGGHC